MLIFLAVRKKNWQSSSEKCDFSCSELLNNEVPQRFINSLAHYFSAESCSQLMRKLKTVKVIDMRNMNFQNLQWLEKFSKFVPSVFYLNVVGNNLQTLRALEKFSKLYFLHYDSVLKECTPPVKSTFLKKFCKKNKQELILSEVTDNSHKFTLPEGYRFVALKGKSQAKDGFLARGSESLVYTAADSKNNIYVAKFMLGKKKTNDLSQVLAKSWQEKFQNKMKIVHSTQKLSIKSFHQGRTLRSWLDGLDLFDGSRKSKLVIKKLLLLLQKIWRKSLVVENMDPTNLIFDENIGEWVLVDAGKLKYFDSCAEASSYGVKDFMSWADFRIYDEKNDFKQDFINNFVNWKVHVFLLHAFHQKSIEK